MIQATTQRPARSRILVSGLVLAALTVTSLMIAKPAHAADFTVTNTNDSGTGSLRQAIENANAKAGADTIKFNLTSVGPNLWLYCFHLALFGLLMHLLQRRLPDRSRPQPDERMKARYGGLCTKSK